uniref:Amino acid transporter transmembrane domain-containing protein n=1 Tax=Physcomitrium patens TaxID=3218 RepID=A0A7I4BNW8_PHYPA
MHAGTGQASIERTVGNIFISTVGAGVLGLPYTFRRSDRAVTTVSVVCAACLTYHCMLLLIKCNDSIAKGGGMQVHTYGDLGQMAYGAPGRVAVDILICISQIGCCVSYLIFIGQKISSVTMGVTDRSSDIIFIILVFQIILSCVGFQTVHPYTTLGSIPFAIGVAVYCFEEFSMTLTLEASMKHPKKFPRILALDFFGIASLYLLFGFVGYLAFGNKTQNIITLNLLQDLSTILVKLGLCIGLFFTYPFMMYPVHEIFEGKLMRSAWFQTIAPPSSHLHTLLRNGVRGASVIGTAVLAVSAPGFAIFISLVGGTVCALLAFVLPSLFHMQLCAGSSSMQSRIADMVLTLCGITFAAYSIYTTVVSIFMTPS